MNQILEVKDENNLDKNNVLNKNKKKKFIFKLQLFVSSFFILFGLLIFSYFKNVDNIYEKNSKTLVKNYNVYKLYSSNNKLEHSDTSNPVFGIIDIPALNITYPIFKQISDEALKIAPCKFYGELSDKNNLCIAGHNYDNGKFFSNLYKLKIGDVVNLYDNSNNLYTFKVYANYEVDNYDTTPIYETNLESQELTLVTCNNSNNKRIIIKCR